MGGFDGSIFKDAFWLNLLLLLLLLEGVWLSLQPSRHQRIRLLLIRHYLLVLLLGFFSYYLLLIIDRLLVGRPHLRGAIPLPDRVRFPSQLNLLILALDYVHLRVVKIRHVNFLALLH